MHEISIGVPQGSVLISLLSSMFNTLFADYTTISLASDSLPIVISKFNSEIQKILQWIKNNQLTANWSKTTVMFLTKRRGIAFPKEVPILLENVEVVSKFKLFGVLIDNKLSFQDHVKNIKALVNRKLFPINRIFLFIVDCKAEFL